MPAKGARCLAWDCPRKSRGRGGHGKRVARCGPGPRSPGGCAGEVREGVEEGQGADAGAGSARSRAGAGTTHAGAWWRRPGARRAVGGRSPGAGPASTPDGRSEDPPAGVGGRRRGSRGKYLKESMPAGRTCWRGPVSSTASPATNPAVRAGPGGHERGDHRPLSRPGRGPRRARPVHGQGPVPACAAPSRSAGPAGEVEAEPGFFEARHRRPLRSGAQGGVRPDR